MPPDPPTTSPSRPPRSPGDPDRRQLGHARGRHRRRPAVRDHRRADQPDRPQGAGRGDEGRRLQPGRARRRSPRSRPARTCSTSTPASRSPTSRRSSPETIQLVQSLTDLPLSIDSSIVEALEAGLAVYKGKPLVNSVTGEEERLERVLPLVKKYGAAVVAISNDETGISEDPDVRFAVAKRIVERAADHGIPREDIVVDPLRHADRRDVDRPAARSSARPAAARRAQGQHDLRRLERELRPAEPRGHQRRVPADGHRRGLTSAITNPLARRASGGRSWRPTCYGQRPGLPARWIRAYREPPAEGERRPPRQPRRAAAAGRAAPGPTSPGALTAPMSRRTEPLVIFTPSGRRGRFPAGTTVLDAARALGVDIDSVCGGRGHLRPLPGRRRASARSPSTASRRRRTTSSPSARSRRSTAPTTGLADRPPAVAARRSSAATSSSTSRPRARSIARSSARTSTSATFEVDPVVRLHYVEVEPPELASPSGDLAALFDALEREWQLTGPRGRPRRHPGAPAGARGGRVRVTVAVHDGATSRRSGRASTTRPTASRSTSARRRSPATSPTSPTARSSPVERRDEPADPVRRGPHEPRLVRDDARRGRGRDDPAPCARRSTGWSPRSPSRPASSATRSSSWRSSATRSCITSCSGIDPIAARLGAVRARHGPGGAHRPPRSSSLRAHPGARVYVLPCIAGHVGADTAGVILAEAPTARSA